MQEAMANSYAAGLARRDHVLQNWNKAANVVKAMHAFHAAPCNKVVERLQKAREKTGELGLSLVELWVGLAAERLEDGTVDFAFACSDGTYNMDFSVVKLAAHASEPQSDGVDGANGAQGSGTRADQLANHIISSLRSYEVQNLCKFVGAGLSREVVELSSQLPSRLWADLDIVPISIRSEDGGCLNHRQDVGTVLGVDEFADSMARKCLMAFGPSRQPRVEVGFRNQVLVDVDNRASLTTLDQYRRTVSEQTWKATLHFASALRERKVKIAFFSATPQGGGVALMRHALVRFLRLVGVDCTWWVPKPKPEVFRITKTNHNIMQGVADPKERLTKDRRTIINDWIQTNADRYWTRSGGPLASPNMGGANVIIVDDPQMPMLVDIAKLHAPGRPVIFRSHIQVRADLADKPETPTGQVWEWIWSSVQHADVFISHPIKTFVPLQVRRETLGYMPATTDWLDGLNKKLSAFDKAYYQEAFNTECDRQRMTRLAFPKRKYIIQVARFDPAKGIPEVLAGYAHFRRHSAFCKGKAVEDTPQLVICGHYSVDDPDGTRVLNDTLGQLEHEYADLTDSIVVMRLGPIDQLLNTLLANAHVCLQLSTREGFEVKVSEGLHMGIPVIASRAGGIPLQVQDKRSGFLVEPEDKQSVARYLDILFGVEKTYAAMSHFAASHVSDEVGTVGNAVCWMYLADKLTAGPKLEPNGRWIWDLARKEAGESFGEHEVRLPRDRTT